MHRQMKDITVNYRHVKTDGEQIKVRDIKKFKLSNLIEIVIILTGFQLSSILLYVGT